MKKESIVTGAAILTAAGIATRLIGFYYRIYMTNIIGSEGIGLYQLIMPLYFLAWTITSSSVTTAVSGLTAKYCAGRRYAESLNILKAALVITGGLSIFLSITVFFGASCIAEFILKDIRAVSSLKVLSLCFPFMAMGSSIRGSFFGIQNSSVPAASQIVEQLVRVFSVMLIFTLYTPSSLEYACAVTAVGIALGELISFIFTVFVFKKLTKNINTERKSKYDIKKSMAIILAPAIPLSSGRILASLLSTLENILIPQKLTAYGYTESNALSVYGKLTGMAMPLIQFPTAILMSFSTALVPVISAAEDINKSEYIRQTIEKSLLFSAIAGVWAFTLFIFFPKQLSYLLYSQSSVGAYVIRLAPICPLLYTHITLAGILNGIGKQKIIFVNNMVSSLINLGFIYFLMPVYGIYVFAAGMFLSLAITSVINILVIKRAAGISFNFAGLFLKPMICGVSAGGAIHFLPITDSYAKPNILVSVIILSIIYSVFIILTGCIKKDDIRLIIPKKTK